MNFAKLLSIPFYRTPRGDASDKIILFMYNTMDGLRITKWKQTLNIQYYKIDINNVSM